MLAHSHFAIFEDGGSEFFLNVADTRYSYYYDYLGAHDERARDSGEKEKREAWGEIYKRAGFAELMVIVSKLVRDKEKDPRQTYGTDVTLPFSMADMEYLF